MSIERDLLKRVISGDDGGDFFVSYDLYKEIYELLAQPEQDQAGAVMPNGVCVSNVYDAYEEGVYQKLLRIEKENYVEMLPSELWLDGYEAGRKYPQKREPLSKEQYMKFFTDTYDSVNPITDFVRAIEQAHGIGVDDE